MIALLAALSLVSCSTAHARAHVGHRTVVSVTTGHARVGALTISGAYIPQPASPDVAAAYLTITNTGATADTMTAITTNVTQSVMAMNETDHDGVGAMTELRAVTIPAHGRISLRPGHAHLMLENPSAALRAGQQVSASITFAHAGTVALTLPVVPLTGTRSASTMPSTAP